MVDALSRPPHPCRSQARRRQQQKPTMHIYRNWRQRLRQKPTPLIFRTWPPNKLPVRRHSSSLKIEFQDIQGHRLAGDSSTGVWRPLVLPKHHQAVFRHLHGIAHPGRLATRRLIFSRFVWPGLSKDVTAWARECAACQRSKIHRHFQVRPKPIPVPQCRFAHIHIDLVGPLNPSNGFNHILTVIDRTSRWMEAIPLANTAAAALFSGWICRFGVPAIITSDRGAQFTSSIWNSLCLLLQIKHQPTTAYTVANEECDSHVCFLSSNFILAYKLNFR